MGVEVVKGAKAEILKAENPLFGVLAHGYQPPRAFNVEMNLAGKPYHAGFSVAPKWNEIITDQVYRPILAEVECLPPGLITSIYAPLRAYLKRNKPEIFAKMQEAVKRTPDREYSVFGDPLVHIIMPFLPSEDQTMLFEAGKLAFFNDFGFIPKGLWLPETAVSKEVLHNAVKSGYEFVSLRDNQITHIPDGVSIDAKHGVCFTQTGPNEEIALLLGNSELSGYVSYTQASTFDAPAFMQGRRERELRNGWNALMTMDLERFGHHQIGAEEFLKRILKIQEQYGFSPLRMLHELEAFKQGRGKTYVEVKENSSWSCDHNLGRWTGECNCDAPSETALQDKRMFYSTLMSMNTFVNSSLDALNPKWRKEFAPLFATLSDDIFTGVNFWPMLFENVRQMGGDEEQAKLYLAKIEIMVGLTSCGWFFGGPDRPERNIPAQMIQGVKDLQVAQPGLEPG